MAVLYKFNVNKTCSHNSIYEIHSSYYSFSYCGSYSLCYYCWGWLILGDRYTGKPSISLPLLISSSVLNSSGSIDGSGTKRLFGPYIGINNNPSKLSKLIYSLLSLSIDWFLLVRASHSAPSSMLSSMLPWIGITIAERLRDRGSDISIRSDDPSKHAKSYRQIPSSIGKIPPRDAYPADVLNIHPPLSERCGKIRMNYFNGTITASPVIETINCDTTESIATNVISITDGQIHTNKSLFLDPFRPATDSGPSATILGNGFDYCWS